MQGSVGTVQTEQWSWILSTLVNWIWAGLSWIVAWQAYVFGWLFSGDSFWIIAGKFLLLVPPAAQLPFVHRWRDARPPVGFGHEVPRQEEEHLHHRGIRWLTERLREGVEREEPHLGGPAALGRRRAQVYLERLPGPREPEGEGKRLAPPERVEYAPSLEEIHGTAPRATRSSR